ncbi:hypothetical protein AB0892_23805 [Streptomyces sp. NPDC005409]|uniref:hypothetical protein n=1 Tax=Streptomyces sp. NPDC005409 TaxID=3155342 RepID=UPI00345248F9
MSTPPPDTYPGCTWADQPITSPDTLPLDCIGSAATTEPSTGLTTRYSVSAYDPTTRTVRLIPELEEDRAGVVRAFSPELRTYSQTVSLDDLDDLRLMHRRSTRDDLTAPYSTWCRHVVKAAFTAGGDHNVPPYRRVYRFWMETSEGNAYRFLVRAPSQEEADDLARRWWEGIPTADGWKDSLLPDGERIHVLSCEGAGDMHWPYTDPIADPV